MNLNTDDDNENASFTRRFVRRILNKVQKLNCCDWSRVESGRLSSDSRQASVGKPMKIRGTISSKSE
ncbi:hypothetical protein KKA08_01295, partial [bacterium]|nr:hypothetical protein [bacterium]